MPSLAHSPADVVAQALVDLGVGVASAAGSGADWQVKVNDEPPDPDRVITVYDREGQNDARLQLTGEFVRHHGVQVRVRSRKSAEGWAKADDAAAALAEDATGRLVTVDGTDYFLTAVTGIAQPLRLGRAPGTDRFLYVVNAYVALGAYDPGGGTGTGTGT